jgi:hypothetical protein
MNWSLLKINREIERGKDGRVKLKVHCIKCENAILVDADLQAYEELLSTYGR